MFRLRDLSLPTKLYGLVIGYSVLVTGVPALAGYLMRTYRVHGPVYEEIATDFKLLNDMDPPLMNVGAAYLMLSEIDSFGGDAGEVRDTTQKFRDYEAKYNERGRTGSPPAGSPRAKSAAASRARSTPRPPTCSASPTRKYLPLIGKGPEAMKKANDILSPASGRSFTSTAGRPRPSWRRCGPRPSRTNRAYGDSHF